MVRGGPDSGPSEVDGRRPADRYAHAGQRVAGTFDHFWEQLVAAYPDARILLTDRDPESWWRSHVDMFTAAAEFEREITDEQRQSAEKSGFARMQTALGTTVSATFDGQVFDKDG
jgi:hypothetical protein